MTKLDVQEIYWEKHIGKIRRSPSRSRYGKLVGRDTGLRAGTGQREESRPAQEKHGSEKVWARLRKSPRKRTAFLGMPCCLDSLVLVLAHA